MAVQSMDFQSVGRSKDASVDCSTVICFSFFTMVLPVLLQRGTRPTWAYPAHYTPALAFSVLPRLRLLTRLAVRSARREPGEHTAFPCSITIPSEWFRSALYTGRTAFAAGYLAEPNPVCVPFGS